MLLLCVYVCKYVRMYVCMYVYMYACMYVRNSCNTSTRALPDMSALALGCASVHTTNLSIPHVTKLCNITFVVLDFPLIILRKVLHIYTYVRMIVCMCVLYCNVLIPLADMKEGLVHFDDITLSAKVKI